MAACLRAPIAFPIRYSPSPESVRRSKNIKLNRGAFRVQNSINFRWPPVDPKDPFVQRIAHAAKHTPELLKRSKCDSDAPPFLSLLDSPMESTEYEGDWMVETKDFDKWKDENPPPDIPSKILNSGCIYIGLPIFPQVTEIIIQQLMYLQWRDSSPILVYVSSTGTVTTDGKLVGRETDGFAIYDQMMQMDNTIYTSCGSYANGVACLLLAAGERGKRWMMPHATASIQLPRVHSIGERDASEALENAKQSLRNRNIFAELLAKHTGNSEKTIIEKMKKSHFMDSVQAMDFGVVDQVRWGNQTKLKEHMLSKKRDLYNPIGGL